MTDSPTSQDELTKIIKQFHDAEPHAYLEAAEIQRYITTHYTPKTEQQASSRPQYELTKKNGYYQYKAVGGEELPNELVAILDRFYSDKRNFKLKNHNAYSQAIQEIEELYRPKTEALNLDSGPESKR